MNAALRVLVWNVRASWLESFVRGCHEYLVPARPGAGQRGRDWPETARVVPAGDLAAADVDVIVLQRPEELELAAGWLGRAPGRDLPAIYVEHDPPRCGVPDARHPVADRQDICLVHVTHFNELMWDSGTTPTTVIEPGVPDPGELYTGELARAAVVIDEPLGRIRLTGTDLLPRFAEGAELDVFGAEVGDLNAALRIGEHRLFAISGLSGRRLHESMARRRAYLHPGRWTSPGQVLIEAMLLGMPVVALAATDVVRTVPPDGGIVSTRIDDLTDALRALRDDRTLARQLGKHAREFALANYGLDRFLRRWDDLLRHTAR